MKKVQSKQLLGLCFVLTLLLIGVVTSVIRSHASAQSSIKSVMFSSSGQRLKTLFEGEPRDPRYSLKDILATRRALPKCGGKQDISLLQRLFGSSVVYAGCPFGGCGGTGWANFTDFCNTGGPCSGSYNSTTPDPDSSFGSEYDHTYCGSSPACGCVSYAC
jgi:hypothetical protein